MNTWKFFVQFPVFLGILENTCNKTFKKNIQNMKTKLLIFLEMSKFKQFSIYRFSLS